MASSSPPPQKAQPVQAAFAHISLTVRSLPRSLKFYTALLATIGWEQLYYHADTGVAGYGIAGGEEVLTLYDAKGRVPEAEVGGLGRWGYGTHLAFTAPTQASVLAFYAAALQNGGTSDGPPGLRDYYGPGYYSAFVSDLDGYRLEAVAHLPVDGEGRVDYTRLE